MIPQKSGITIDPKTVARMLGGTASGNQVNAPAPGHSKADRSLSVRIDAAAPDGFVVHAHAGEDTMAMRDYVREKLGLPTWEPGQPREPAPVITFRPKDAPKPFSDRHLLADGYQFVCAYSYTSDDGVEAFEICRYEHPTKPKTFLQRHSDEAGRVMSGRYGDPIFYRLHEIATTPDEPIFFVEGEKDADNLVALGFLATTVPNNAWPDDLSAIEGRTIYVLADNDTAGEARALKAIENLTGVATVHRVALPDLPPKGDVTDWLNAGGNADALMALCPPALPAPAAPKAANDNRKFAAVDAETLLGMHFAPVKYVIPGFVAEGLTILGGRPKLGKSWLALGFGVGVATGGKCLGVECQQGDALYLALEDNQRRLQDRLRLVLPRFQRPDMSRLSLQTEAPKVGAGLVEMLDVWRKSVDDPRLVIIDTLAIVRPPKKGNQDSYAADYEALSPLQRFASEHRLAVVVVTHVRKMEAADPLEMISGTNGLTGAADSIMVLDRSADGCKLYGRGRDIEEVEKALKFEAGIWTALGNVDDVKRSDERKQIIDALADSGEPMKPADIAKATGLKSMNVRYLLGKMVAAGECEKTGYGLYHLPSHPSHPSQLESPEINYTSQYNSLAKCEDCEDCEGECEGHAHSEVAA